MKVTVYCKLNYQGKRGALFNFVKMSIIHYGEKEIKNKFICEDGMDDADMKALTAD